VTPKDNFYSLFVSWAKIILPMAGIALLSTLFLFARNTDQSSLPLAELEEMARSARLTGPTFSGITNDGTIFTVSAGVAAPDPADLRVVNIEKIRLLLSDPEGASVEITAARANYDGNTNMVSLLGLTRLVSSVGYSLETRGITADISSGTVTTAGALEAQAPFGEISAGRLTILRDPAAGGQQMVFQNGVRLVYQPRN
jgi:lipopolysaccharide export system protein LptC